MKRIKKSTLIAVILIVLGIVAIGVSFVVAKGNISNYSFAEQRYELKKYSAKSNINELCLTELSQDVTIREGDVDCVCVSYYENGIDTFEISEQNCILTLERKRDVIDLNLNFFIGGDDADTVITVPRGFAGKVIADSESADVELIGISLKKASVKTNSGEVSIENVKAAGISIETHSGEVDLENVDSESIYIKTRSGDVEGEIFGRKSDYRITVDTSGGDCNLRNTESGERTLNIDTASGDVEIEFKG